MLTTGETARRDIVEHDLTLNLRQLRDARIKWQFTRVDVLEARQNRLLELWQALTAVIRKASA